MTWIYFARKEACSTMMLSYKFLQKCLHCFVLILKIDFPKFSSVILTVHGPHENLFIHIFSLSFIRNESFMKANKKNRSVQQD